MNATERDLIVQCWHVIQHELLPELRNDTGTLTLKLERMIYTLNRPLKKYFGQTVSGISDHYCHVLIPSGFRKMHGEPDNSLFVESRFVFQHPVKWVGIEEFVTLTSAAVRMRATSCKIGESICRSMISPATRSSSGAL